LAQRKAAPIVSIRQVPGRGGTAVLTYTSQKQYSFAQTTAQLDQMGINIVDARIMPTADGFSVDTYHVLEDTNKELSDTVRIRDSERQLQRTLENNDSTLLTVTRRAPRQVRMFSTPTQINFADDTVNNRTILELVAGDRP